MVNNNLDMTLDKHVQEYANDPEFIAEGLSIKVIEEVLEYLEQRGLNQSWLAEEMGVSRAFISRMLNAPPNLTLLTIARIAVALGTTPDVRLNVADSRNGVELGSLTLTKVPGQTRLNPKSGIPCPAGPMTKR